VAEDIANIAKYIRHPAKEPDYRKGRPHSEFVTSIREQGYDLSVESLLIELEKGMRNLLPTEF
jgi:lipoate-protein ligase A